MKTILLVFSLLITPGLAQVRNVLSAQLVKCNDTFFSSGAYGSPSACGGDPLTRGFLNVKKRRPGPKYGLKISLVGANPWNLYSVYYLPIGGDAVTDKVFVGEFMTDAAGDTGGGVWVKDCTASFTPACLTASGPGSTVDMNGLGFTIPASGQFLIYSRGISKKDNDGDGIYETWKTSDSTDTGTLNNPVLWGGSGGYDGVQFISAWK